MRYGKPLKATKHIQVVHMCTGCAQKTKIAFKHVTIPIAKSYLYFCAVCFEWAKVSVIFDTDQPKTQPYSTAL